MAVVKCPECGRENIPDIPNSTIVCPECGYHVGEYYSNLRREERKKIRKKAIASLKPEFLIGITAGFVLGIGLLAAFICLALESGDMFWVAILAGVGLIGVCIYSVVIWISIDDIKNYRLAKRDYDAYIRKKQRKEKEERASRKAEQERMEQEEDLLALRNPACPYCSSHRTKKISGFSRGASVAFMGIASSKIGKQWHCEDCGSNF